MAAKLGDMLNGLTNANCHKECMIPRDGSRLFFFLFFFDNKKPNSLAIAFRSAKAKNYAENIIFFIDGKKNFFFMAGLFL